MVGSGHAVLLLCRAPRTGADGCSFPKTTQPEGVCWDEAPHLGTVLQSILLTTRGGSHRLLSFTLTSAVLPQQCIIDGMIWHEREENRGALQSVYWAYSPIMAHLISFFISSAFNLLLRS